VKPYIQEFLAESKRIIDLIDQDAVESLVQMLVGVRERGGRLFIIGSGGGAGHASHAVNDFRKIANIEAYAPTDNVSELTARINDDGWETSYVNWLKVSRLGDRDTILVLSVGGGDLERNVSSNLVRCVEYGLSVGSTICGIVGRDGGYTARVGHAVVIVPTISGLTVTPQVEGFQALLWHLVVSHPSLRSAPMRWESLR
jgi:D-sedoheptulose 7-phosphate isomerase